MVGSILWKKRVTGSESDRWGNLELKQHKDSFMLFSEHSVC